jgi:hypothetical protein
MLFGQWQQDVLGIGCVVVGNHAGPNVHAIPNTIGVRQREADAVFVIPVGHVRVPLATPGVLKNDQRRQVPS